MASCAILEFNPRIEYSVSFEAVNRAISLTLIIGDFPLFDIEIVVAPHSFAVFSASIISFDEPECEIPTATSFLFMCDAEITCI